MREGTASHTARSVAAHRLEYARPGAPHGNPEADEALTRDVAAGLPPRHNRMHEYLRARTAFFDRVVVHTLDHGITQVVIGGAGYDGRAFRYARPGVRWFEVDHPATQADKRERVARLALDASHLAFIPADFAVDPVTEPLLAAGLDPALVTLVLLEGVAVYLDPPVLGRALTAFRRATPAGSTLAISMSIHTATADTRRRFQERVGSIGEPARSVLTDEEASDLLAGAGWELSEGPGRRRSAGLLLARATTALAHPERTRPAQAPSLAPRGVSPAPGAPSAEPGTPTPGSFPLPALLSQALVAFTIEADNEAEHRLPHRTQDYGLAPGAALGAPWLTSLLMWANCLRHLPDEGITIAELRDRARTGTNLDGMRRWRYVTFTPDPGHGKRPAPEALIRPTPWGIAARDIWQEVTAQVESCWRDRLGGGTFDALRAALAGIVERLDPALPDCLPILGYALFTRRDPARKTRTGRPASGTGPVSAAPAVSLPVRDLPLWALLSRTLLAFAAQYEAEPGPSLAISANILRVLTEAGVFTKDIPALAGVSKESVAMALGPLRNSGLVTEGRDPAGSRFKFTRLTPRGVLIRDEYPALAADIEQDWRARFGDNRVTALREALELLTAGDPPRLYAGLAPYPDNWRAQAGPLTTLPHYPMTLHRGGYPDGS